MKVKFNKMPSEVQSKIDASDSARKLLSRLQKGTPDTERTWFYENEDPETILSSVVAALEAMTDWPKISSWDLSKVEKFQPQGKAAPFKDRLEKFDEYFIHLDPPSIFRSEAWKKAKKRVVQMLGLNRTGNPLSIDEVIGRGISESKYSTNSGYPLFRRRKSEEALAECRADYRRAITDAFPFTVGSRAQMGKVGVDARFIFMAPMAVNAEGQRFSIPFQEYLTKRAEKMLRKVETSPDASDLYAQRLLFFTPWLGWDKVQKVISEYWGGDTNLRFGADYTKMDQHFNKYHALEAFDVIKEYFQRQWWPELKQCILYPFTAPIITSEGYVEQEHALLSGSEWTNLLETVFNFILCEYLLTDDVIGPELVAIVPMGIGDDQLWLLTYRADLTFDEVRTDILNDVIDTFEKVGLPGNPTKQDGVEDQDTSAFLQRKIWTEYNGPEGNIPHAGVYPLVRNLTSQVFPERYFNAKEYGWEAFAIRVIMIAENCCTHPLFDWYVAFIARANKNILRFVRLTDSEVDHYWEEVKNIAGFRPTYNQEKQDRPLREFETFRRLRKLI
jgi:uncharacterized protein YukE